MNLEGAGRLLVILGVSIAVLGGLVWLAGKALPGLDRLPGTIRIQGSGFTCLFPILGSILLSVLLTLALNLIAKFLK